MGEAVGRALPNWLMGRYFTLLCTFTYLPFKVEEARPLLGGERVAIILSKMNSFGWLERVDRGVYRVVHPLIAMMDSGWRKSIAHRDKLPVLELVVASLLQGLSSRLESIVLFGSMARGNAAEESDIDLLVVAEGLPESYGERTKLMRHITSSKALDDVIAYFWEKKRVYTNIDLIVLSPGEAETTHPFYLDMAEEAVIIRDRDGTISKKLEAVKERLKAVGAVKVVQPDGGWYWVLTPEPRAAGHVEI